MNIKVIAKQLAISLMIFNASCLLSMQKHLPDNISQSPSPNAPSIITYDGKGGLPGVMMALELSRDQSYSITFPGNGGAPKVEVLYSNPNVQHKFAERNLEDYSKEQMPVAAKIVDPHKVLVSLAQEYLTGPREKHEKNDSLPVQPNNFPNSALNVPASTYSEPGSSSNQLLMSLWMSGLIGQREKPYQADHSSPLNQYDSALDGNQDSKDNSQMSSLEIYNPTAPLQQLNTDTGHPSSEGDSHHGFIDQYGHEWSHNSDGTFSY